MKTNKEKIPEQPALDNHTSIAEVRSEIEKEIDEAMKDPNSKLQNKIGSYKFKSDKPTPEELIIFLIKKSRKGKS